MEISQYSLQKQKKLALQAFASSTLSTYGTGLARYYDYCNTINLPEVHRAPCSTETVGGFIAFLSGTYSRTTINNFLAAIKAWHNVNLLPYNVNDNIINTLLCGALRMQPLPRPKREPITMDYLTRILKQLNLSNPEQAAVASCLTTVFYCCARLGEFTVPSFKAFNAQNYITISGVSFQKDRYFNKVTAFRVPHTKTSPNGETLFWASQNSETNPQFFLLNHLQVNEPKPHEHLFAFKTHNGKLPLTRNIFLRNIKFTSEKANIPFLTGHSLRIGSTLEYLLRGIPFEVVKQIGRWTSNSFTLYLREHGRILAPYLQSNPIIHSEYLEYSHILLR
ncbi:reverse transcriptase ribonuclease h [Pyrrhoderma noxium]|uniref:Reverse transcriptase ribonuclease h n=1 Tax=Pyrrhoderma noxium TaxID=2282107 RepID=A0A286UFC9_9AGAM|nr:reverse transcriptase ribonuclease h [Pyrrhoderma noxium]